MLRKKVSAKSPLKENAQPYPVLYVALSRDGYKENTEALIDTGASRKFIYEKLLESLKCIKGIESIDVTLENGEITNTYRSGQPIRLHIGSYTSEVEFWVLKETIQPVILGYNWTCQMKLQYQYENHAVVVSFNGKKEIWPLIEARGSGLLNTDTPIVELKACNATIF